MAEQFERALSEHAPLLRSNPHLSRAIKHVDACVAIAKGILIRNRVHDFEAADVVAVAEMLADCERDDIHDPRV